MSLSLRATLSLLFCIIVLSGCTGRTMNRVITSWKGATIDDAIKAWGYPSEEKVIAGHKLYLWQEDNGVEISGGFWPGAKKWGGQSAEHKYCNRILEVDSNGTIIGGQWNGTDCPKLFSSWERAQEH